MLKDVKHPIPQERNQTLPRPLRINSAAFFSIQRLLYLFHLGQLSPRVLVVPQVLLVAHQDDRNIGTEVFHLRCPLLWDIFCPGGKRREMSRNTRVRERAVEGATIKRGQAAQSHGTEHFSWWIALQTAWGKDVFSCSNPASHQVH